MGNFTKSTPQDFQTNNCGWSSFPPHQRKVNIILLFWLTNLSKLCPRIVPNLVKIGQKLWPLECKHTGGPTTPLPQQHNDFSALAQLEMYFYDLPNEGLHKKGILTDLDILPTAPVWCQQFQKVHQITSKILPKLVLQLLLFLKLRWLGRYEKVVGHNTFAWVHLSNFYILKIYWTPLCIIITLQYYNN